MVIIGADEAGGKSLELWYNAQRLIVLNQPRRVSVRSVCRALVVI